MFSTPEFWVLISFVLFIGLFGKRGIAYLTQFLGQHRQKVASQLEEAQRLHDEALSLLNSYKKKHEEALSQAEKIISDAETEALEFKKSTIYAFEKVMDQKERALIERIAIEGEEAKSKLRNQLVDEALAIVEDLISREKKEKKELTKTSLKELSKINMEHRF